MTGDKITDTVRAERTTVPDIRSAIVVNAWTTTRQRKQLRAGTFRRQGWARTTIWWLQPRPAISTPWRRYWCKRPRERDRWPGEMIIIYSTYLYHIHFLESLINIVNNDEYSVVIRHTVSTQCNKPMYLTIFDTSQYFAMFRCVY